MLLRSIQIFAIAIFYSTSDAQSWKPVSGPATSFSIRQSHPVVGTSSSSFRTSNALVETTGAADDSIGRHGVSPFADQTPPTGFSEDAFVSGYNDAESKLFSSSPGSGFPEDTCSVDKYAFDYEGTVQYKHQLPKMEQFTICSWMRFTNHTGDHTLFTYSADDEPREIQFWVANAKGLSFISMAVHGQSLFRLNYPLKMRVWHHACASWNGKTGEWQLWVKAERVGRGFHNRLVGHVIEPHGIAFSGGPSITGETAASLHFELTLLQIYKVALSAGKAHRDHKHHHVHHFNHDGVETTTTTAPPPPQSTQPTNSLLANGQFPSRVRINLAGQQVDPSPSPSVPSQVAGGLVPKQGNPLLNTNFIQGQFNTAERLLAQQLTGSFVQSAGGRNSQSPVTFPGQSSSSSSATSQQSPSSLFANFGTTGAIRFVDSDSNSSSRLLYKRGANSKTGGRSKSRQDKKLNKRGLVMLSDGSIVEDGLLGGTGFEFDGLAQFGLPAFKEDLQKRMNIEDEIREHDREPAEGEVKAVLEICTSCDIEPFKGAVALNWKNLRVILDGALKGRSVGGCGFF